MDYSDQTNPPVFDFFKCPNCHKETCLKCQRDSHRGLSCHEASEEGILLRQTVEEAMSEAKIRRCANPHCNTPFSKPDGCNKMSCHCGHSTCYVCRADITDIGYRHFCNKAACSHRRCGVCPVWTREDHDDEYVKRRGYQTEIAGAKDRRVHFLKKLTKNFS